MEETYIVIKSFWQAVVGLLQPQWANARKHFLTKGIGVYALMDLAADLCSEASRRGIGCDEQYFTSVLSDFIRDFDWSRTGPLKGLGGEIGAEQAHALLLRHRAQLGRYAR